MIPVNSSLTQLIFAIHGVGNPRPGVVKTAIEENLHNAGLEIFVQEFNWNKQLPYQLDSDTPFKGLGWNRVKFLAVRLADACLIDLPQVPFRLTPWPWKAHYFTFQVAEGLLALLISINTIFFPALFLSGPIDNPEFRVDWFFILLRIMTWVNRILLTSIGLSAFCASITAIIRWDLSPLWIGMRRLVLLILRPCILVVLLIFSLPIASIFTKLGLWGTAILLWFVVIVSLLGGLPERFIIIAWWLLILLSSALLTYMLMRILGPAAKVLLDIFLYITDREHRRYLQRLLDAELAPILGKVSELVLICHSLGTVLAIDSLLHSKIWTGQETITLITYGSPLKRFFTRFFPGHIFPFSIDECARYAAARIGRFRWLNGYRPHDEIGTLIGLSNSTWTKEFSTDQPRRWFNHPDYWSDPEVRDKTIKCLHRLPFSEALKQQSDLSLEQTTAPSLSAKHRQLITTIIGSGALVIVIIIALASLIASIHYRHNILDTNYHDAQDLLNTGTITKATVSYSSQAVFIQRSRRYGQFQSQPLVSDFYSFNQSFEIEYFAVGKLQRYKQESGTEIHQTYYNVAKSDQWVNWGKLAKFVTRDQQAKVLSWPDYITGDTKTVYTLSGKLTDILLLYDPSRPDHFVLPEFKPTPDTVNVWFALIEGGIFSLLLIMLYGVSTWCAYLVILLFIGDIKLLQYFCSLSWPYKDS